MRTPCVTIDLANQGRRKVRASFDGGRMSSDGGTLLMQAVDQLRGLVRRLGACFVDHCNPRRCEHSLQRLLAQRLVGLALGNDEISDCDRLRDDSLRALAPGTDDLSRERRLRERNRGHPLAGSRRCWWRCSGTATPRPRTRSSGTLPTTRCTASSGGVSSTAILTVTATCRGTLPAGRTCCPGGCCGGPTWTRRTGR